MGVGQSWAGALGVGTESTFGTVVPVSLWLPILSESLKPKIPNVERRAIYGLRQIQAFESGLHDIAGDVTLEPDGETMGQFLYYWNGQKSAAAPPGIISGAPTVALASGGSLAAGSYKYAVAPVWKNLDSGRAYIGPRVSPLSNSVTTASPNFTVNVSWMNPSDNPGVGGLASRWVRDGTAIFRTPANGADGSEVLLTVVTNPNATTYSDDGSVTATTAGTLTTVTRHTFSPANTMYGADPLPSCTLEKVLDLSGSGSHRFAGLKLNSLRLGLQKEGIPSLVASFLGQRFVGSVPNSSPTLSAIRPFMGWKALLYKDTSLLSVAASLDLTLNNNLEKVFGLDGNAYPRAIRPKLREITGTLSATFESQDQVSSLLSGTEFALNIWIFGQGVASWTVTTIGGTDYFPWPRAFYIYLPACVYDEAGGLLSGADQMVESLPFRTRRSPSANADCILYLDNTTTSYS